MNNPLKTQIITQIKSLKETPFENFVVELLLKYYGANNFIPTREKGDGGCDGIIVDTKTIIACYGPEKYLKKSFDKKISDDFGQYQLNWQGTYPNWMVIVNHDVCPNEINKIEELKQNSQIWGIKNLVTIIEDELSSKQRRDIAKYLNIDNDFIATDYIKEILDDLLGDSSVAENIKYEKPLYLGDKIVLNFNAEDQDEFSEEYKLYAEGGVLSHIGNIIHGYDDNEINQIKIKVRNDFNSSRGIGFKNKIIKTTDAYRNKYSLEDDELLYYTKAIIMYFFDQCIIGKKTKEENDNTSPRQ